MRSLKAWLKNAFALNDSAVFTADDEQLLKRVAEWVTARRLGTPAVLFLESYRPMGYLGSQALAAAEPFVEMALSTFPGLNKQLDEKDYNRFMLLLERRETVNRLIKEIGMAEKDFQ